VVKYQLRDWKVLFPNLLMTNGCAWLCCRFIGNNIEPTPNRNWKIGSLTMFVDQVLTIVKFGAHHYICWLYVDSCKLHVLIDHTCSASHPLIPFKIQ
jgi:hypothetical protein